MNDKSNEKTFKNWLDNLNDTEATTEKQLRRHLKRQIDLIERSMFLANEYVFRISNPASQRIRLVNNKFSVPDKCEAAAVLLLEETTDRILAARRMFISGYFSRALACLRDMGEALYWSELCRQNLEMATTWLDNKQLKKPKQLRKDNISLDYIIEILRGSIEKDRTKESLWDKFSNKGVHPLIQTTEISKLNRINLNLLTPSKFLKSKEYVTNKESKYIIDLYLGLIRNFLWVLYSNIFLADLFLDYLERHYSFVIQDDEHFAKEIRYIHSRTNIHVNNFVDRLQQFTKIRENLFL